MTNKAAVFDIDGTLIPRSLERMFIACLLQERLLTPKKFLRNFYHAFKEVRRGSTFSEQRAFYLRGISVDAVERMLPKCWPRIEGRILPQMAELISLFKACGFEICLLSGTLEFLADRLGRLLNADVTIATALEVADRKFTGRCIGVYPHGAAKLKLFKKVAVERGWDASMSWAFGDSFGDRFILEAVGHPVAVNPSGKLRKLARSRNWLVIEVGKRTSPFSTLTIWLTSLFRKS